MTTIRVTFADGHTIDVRTSHSPSEIRAHYLGIPHAAVLRIDFLDPISGTPCINGRIA
jgi:hypothetical protein